MRRVIATFLVSSFFAAGVAFAEDTADAAGNFTTKGKYELITKPECPSCDTPFCNC